MAAAANFAVAAVAAAGEGVDVAVAVAAVDDLVGDADDYHSTLTLSQCRCTGDGRTNRRSDI